MDTWVRLSQRRDNATVSSNWLQTPQDNAVSGANDILFAVRLPKLLQGVLNFCYPSVCAACERFVDDGAMLCLECRSDLDALVNAPACPQCAMPAASDAAPCPYCHGAGVAHYERVCRLGIFEDPIKHLIHQMKYHNRWPMGEFLADRLCETERAKGLLTETQVLVPVPLHFKRHVQRGYNQADVIARRIGSRTRLPVVHALRRTRNTETQTHLHSHETRLANMRDAFALRRAAARIRDKHVMVIDDVMTSRATLSSVARVLKEAQPASLCAMVIAIADSKNRSFQAI